MDYGKLNKQLVKTVIKGCLFSKFATYDEPAKRVIVDVDANEDRKAAKELCSYFTGITSREMMLAASLRGKLFVVSTPTSLSVIVKDEKGKTSHELKLSDTVAA